MIDILETLRNDDIILNKISLTMDKQDFKDSIDDAIDEAKDIETSDKNALCIKLYVESKSVKKIEMTMNDPENNKSVAKVEISKEQNGNDLVYTINVNADSEDDGKISIDTKIEYKNLLDLNNLNNIEENYEIRVKTTDTYEDEMDISLNYTNSKTFTTDVNIEGINSNNATIINDATDDELDELLTKIYENLGLY